MSRLIPLRVNARVILAWMATCQLVLLVCTLVYLWIRVFYLGDLNAVAALSFPASEQPPVPLVPWRLGAHTFGDFLWPFEVARVANPWTDDKMIPSNYPSALITFFKLLTNFPYTLALGIFIVLAIASMIFPVAHSARRFDIKIITSAICLFVLLSFPFEMTIDRGNAQWLIVVPIYVFSIAWREGRWRLAAIGISIAAIFKLYPALLVVVLLVERRFKDAAIVIALTGAITMFLFALYPGGIVATVRGFYDSLTRFSAPSFAEVTTNNYSAFGLLVNIASMIPGSPSQLVPLLLAHPWVLGITYSLAVAAVVNARRLPFVVRLACAISLLSLSIPLSYGYSFAAIVVVVAELLRTARFDVPDADIPLPLAITLGIALTATLAQWPYKTVTGNSIGTVIVPATWIVLTGTAIVYRYGPTRRSAKRTDLAPDLIVHLRG